MSPENQECAEYDRLAASMKEALDALAQMQLSVQAATAAFLDFRSAMHVAQAKLATDKALADEAVRNAEDKVRRVAKRAIKSRPASTGQTEVYQRKPGDK